ncbi:hypothetical protein ACLOJK_009462 [Asimina triloba]
MGNSHRNPPNSRLIFLFPVGGILMAKASRTPPAFFFIALLLLATAAAAVAAAVLDDSENKSSLGGLFWATAKEEADLLAKAAASSAEERDEFEGGFSSLDSMLQWAIGHSDPTKLKEKAQDAQQLSANELAKRQQEIKPESAWPMAMNHDMLAEVCLALKTNWQASPLTALSWSGGWELMEKLKMPSDAELMQIAISDLNNSSTSLDDRHRALNELLTLVEPIDNANASDVSDLNKLGGLVAVIQELNNVEPEIRTTSAWILGKASQNNPVVQKQVLQLGALPKLMLMVKSNFTEEAIKALYAVSAVIRNNIAGQELFYAEAGHLILQDIMSNSNTDIRLRRKSVFLVADLAESELEQLERRSKAQLPFFGDRLFLKSVVDLMKAADLDLQEKVYTVVHILLQLNTMEALVLKDFCDLGGALERMRERLQELMTEEFQKDYARDLESLRKEVEDIFHRKLEKKCGPFVSEF